MGIPFGRYELLRKIAAGGMGQVLLAKKGAEGFEKLVVIKRILPHLVEDEEFFAMFIDEAKITMRLDHPNIARINEFSVENGVHYIEMEYVAGEDLRRLEKRARQVGADVPLGVTVRIIADAAAGLDFAHKAKDSKGHALDLVHRDVSPQNVLIGFDGAVKLIDFGVAKAMGRSQNTATGILKGKFPYMSPEQADGLDLDARSDVFALGIVLWEQLTGKRLFKGDNDLMTQRLVKTCQVPAPNSINPKIPKKLDAIVLKALAKNVNERHADAAEFRMALENFALKSGIPSSSAHLSAFMQEIYAERILREQDPKHFEEDSGLTDLDAGVVGHAGSTKIDKGRQQETRKTGPLSSAKSDSKKPVIAIAAIGALAAAGVVALVFWPKPAVISQPVTSVDAMPPPPVLIKNAPQHFVDSPVVNATPEPIALTLQSEPSGAEVEIGGEKKGLTPIDVKLDRAHLPTLLRVTRDGYEPYQATLTDSSGPTLSVPLKKKPTVRAVGQGAPQIKTSR